MAPKTVALTGAACVTIGWLLASLLAPPVASLQSRPAPRPARDATQEPPSATFTEQLQLRLQRSDAAPTSRRNPFVFGARERSLPAASARQSAAEDLPAAAPAAPSIVAPPYSLAGVATTAGPAGDERTAVLSDGSTVHLVRAGETLGAYTVIAVRADAVELADQSGTRFVISLR